MIPLDGNSNTFLKLACEQLGSSVEEQTMFYRANQDCICLECGEPYWKHPMDNHYLSFQDEPWLHILCNGDLVKL